MAVVILGGLLTSTLLNVFLLPVLYARWGRSAGPVPGSARAVETGDPAEGSPRAGTPA